MVELMRGEREAGVNVLRAKIREVPYDFGSAGSTRQHFEHVGHPHACSRHDRPTARDAAIGRNAWKSGDDHGATLLSLIRRVKPPPCTGTVTR